MARYSLIDIGFKNFSIEQKRYIFMLLDRKMKMLHEENKMVTSFEPKDIYYENEVFDFKEVKPISPIVADDKDSAIIHNIIGLSNLAFCSYLPGYDLEEGLLHPLAVSHKFHRFEPIFNEIDKEYYKSVLVDTYQTGVKPEVTYYYDYVNKKENESEMGASPSLVKATEAGRLLSDSNSEAAFSNVFFLVTVVACLVLEFAGVVLYYLNK